MTTTETRPVTPAGDKAAYVREMFSGIADRYDLLNSVLSFNRHKSWRRAAVRMAALKPGDSALDICCGTGDFAVELFKSVGPAGQVIAGDFCAPMVVKGKPKTDAVSNGRILMMLSDAQKLPYPSGVFDCVTVGFGIRNVADTLTALQEMCRVLRPGGRAVCLEFNRPQNPMIRAISNFYELKVLPKIGAMLSRGDAYKYLPESIQIFHSREALAELMRESGLRNIVVRDLNFGSVCIHMGVKNDV